MEPSFHPLTIIAIYEIVWIIIPIRTWIMGGVSEILNYIEDKSQVLVD